ncbi:AbfB domain-containing protein, partial [Streptomyces kebangsaanensis]|uniref:AbfB domain-containing protein n=1 Tax=Streptomyces kebangsaanensis TaxID=864058 RepID=UPI001F284680
CHSFATADGGYLRHRGFLLRAEPDDGSALFRQDATFCPRVSAHAGAVMLESVNHPGRFLRHQNFQLRLDPYQSGDLYVADSAFRLVDGLA